MHYPPLNYKERCVNMNILPLSFRREMADIKLFFKSMFTTNFSNNISELVKTYIPNSRLRSHHKDLLVESKLVKTETYKEYYSNRIVPLWNKLPPELRVDHSLDIFVDELDNFYQRQ